jgi:hypothetical protein
VNGWDEPPPGLWVGAAEAAAAAGVALAPEQVSALEAARTFRLHRRALALEQVERLGRELPLPQLRLPHLLAPAIGPAELAELAGALAGAVETLAPVTGTA